MVILLSLLRVVEHLVSLGSLLKLLLSLLVARVAVWVILDSYLAIGFLYLVFRCLLVYAQHLVIVSLSHSFLVLYD